MHGRPRKAPKHEDSEASTRKAANLRTLQSQLLHNHHELMYAHYPFFFYNSFIQSIIHFVNPYTCLFLFALNIQI